MRGGSNPELFSMFFLFCEGKTSLKVDPWFCFSFPNSFLVSSECEPNTRTDLYERSCFTPTTLLTTVNGFAQRGGEARLIRSHSNSGRSGGPQNDPPTPSASSNMNPAGHLLSMHFNWCRKRSRAAQCVAGCAVHRPPRPRHSSWLGGNQSLHTVLWV